MSETARRRPTISVLFFQGCPNHRPTVHMARTIVSELRLDADVEEVEVASPDQVDRLRFLGSPTVQVDGVDIEAASRTRTDFAMSCRLYDTPDGLPSRAMLLTALGVADVAAGDRLPGRGGRAQDVSCCETAPVHARVPATGDRVAGIAAGGSIATAALSSACCWLPLLLVAFGASAAGVGGFFELYRPYFVVGAAGLLGLGYYLVFFRRQKCEAGSACAVQVPRLRRVNQTVLVAATVLVGAFVFFPNYVGTLLARPPAPVNAARDNPAGSAQLASAEFRIGGMTCEGCANILRGAIAKLPDVVSVDIDYPSKTADVRYRAEKRVSDDQVIRAAKLAGYEATPVAGSTARPPESP